MAEGRVAKSVSKKNKAVRSPKGFPNRDVCFMISL